MDCVHCSSSLVHVIILCVCVVLSALAVLMFYLDAGQLTRSQYQEGPATGHLDTGSSWFLRV
jgi:cell division protein FtsL